MTTRVFTAQHDASDAVILQVECAVAKGTVGVNLIGNVSEVCRSGLERARAALENIGFELPPKRILINVSPVELRKDGGYLDLPLAIALAHLMAGKSFKESLDDWVFAAELSIDGELKPIKAAVPLALSAQVAQKRGVVVARENEASLSRLQALSPGKTPFEVFSFSHLSDVLKWLRGEGYEEPEDWTQLDATNEGHEPDFDDMTLSPELKTLAMTCAVGLHSLLMQGPPGTGKSMLASRLTSIFPQMPPSVHVETLKVHSLLYESLSPSLLLGRPPYRAPHHQASTAAVIGIPDHPGEISLAHGGLLFLDEFPEFRRDIIEALREPLETGHVRISRAQKKVVRKSQVTLIAAANGCPCGWLGSRLRRCLCPSTKVLAYRRRISGPILDRIDMVLYLEDGLHSAAEMLAPPSPTEALSQTENMRQKVATAREWARCRNEKIGIAFNRDLKADQLLAASCCGSKKFYQLVEKTTPRSASRRSTLRALRVARSLADLDGSIEIDVAHLHQAWKWLPSSGDELI